MKTAMTCAVVAALLASVLAATGSVSAQSGSLFPWEAPPGARSSDAVGAGFELSRNDLAFIMQSIKISEAHAAVSSLAAPNCGAIIGDGANQIPPGPNAAQVPFGVRTISGVCNNLVPGNYDFGAADRPFPRLTTPDYRLAEAVGPNQDFNGPVPPNLGDTTSYADTTFVIDSQPRVVSNLIVDQSGNNPAAGAAAGGTPLPPCTGVPPCPIYDIPNVAPDEGLSAPFNDMFTFFGQFFDHGLDLTTKTGELVLMPLHEDDPLYVPGSFTNFMAISRATNPTNVPLNQTSPYVDQNQTYTSHPSHQVFLREYVAAPAVPAPDAANPAALSTGRLIEGAPNSMATWAHVKAQAATLLGIELVDEDSLAIPLLLTDLYGKYIPGAAGYPQFVVDTGGGVAGLVEANPATNDGNPVPVPANAIRSGHAFLLDIAHHAAPGAIDLRQCPPGTTPGPKTPDLDPGTSNDGDCTTYDDEMLDAHFIAGDGRVNENIALTAVHHVFHHEHNRLIPHIKDVLTGAPTIDPLVLADWQTSPGVWNGERLFQAAKFATEMQYQHLVFEEFARKVQPFLNPFAGYDTSIDAAISVEFSQAVYRFGHSMLNETVRRYNANGTPNDATLFEVFLNPPRFLDGTYPTAVEAAGAIFRGGTAQVGQEIDEFVVEALRNQLVGLPLDLPAINIARGRDYGIPKLNGVRRQIFAQTADPALRPYESWMEFGLELKHPESLVNFIAAYGTHPFIDTYDGGTVTPGLTPGTRAARRAAAEQLVNAGVDAPLDTFDFMTSTATVVPGNTQWATSGGAATTTGLDDVDLWVGGLAEKREIFGGFLGTTFNYVFERQLQNLQDGDRFYYLHRLAGTDFLASLEGNSFGELVSRNTDAENLPADVFSRPDYFFDAGFQNGHPSYPAIQDDPATGYDETGLLLRMPNLAVRFGGAEHTNFVGGAGNDRIHSGDGDDTVRGNDGNDFLEGDGGNDSIIGGEGNDVITDTFGDDTLKGGPGNDALRAGPGFDLLQGNAGHDYIQQGTNLSETFAGSGNDIIYGGGAAAIIFAGNGDDWIEGGEQADLIQGGNGNPFQTDIDGGHDVLIGQGGNDDYDSEGGDDILVAGPGTSRFEGMIGFDWVTHYLDTQVVNSDLTKNLAAQPTQEFRDRFDLVEGLSGWNGNDTLLGESGAGRAEAGVFAGDSNLDAAGIARIAGLADVLAPGATGFTAGNILLGGEGNDIIEGRGEDDVIDGDRWLRVQLEAPGLGRSDYMAGFQEAVFNGTLNPGDISIIREIVTPAVGGTADVAVYGGPQADYNVTQNGDGSVTVDHARGCGDPTGVDPCPPRPGDEPGIDDGTDLVRNVEILRFSDGDVDPFLPPVVGLLRATTTPAVPSQLLVDGVIRDTWGLTWVEIPVGTHEVCFTDVSGFEKPACQTTTVNAGVTSTVEGVFTGNGFLQVQTNPPLPSTITVNGDPANDWGVWTDLVPGSYTVCFGAVAGFDAPPCETATVASGANTLVVGDFTPNAAAPAPTGHGMLRVMTNPAVPAKITLDQHDADSWGLTWLKVPAGPHEVCFGDVSGFSTPACQQVTVVAGATTVVNANYVPRGQLRVTTVNAQPSTIRVNGVPRNAWGMWTDMAPGTYQVCFGEVGGFAPPCQSAVVSAGALTEVTGVWP